MSAADSRERELVARLLGRAPSAPYRVAVRCPHGTPAVIENAPVDGQGRPFPTRHWLLCGALVAAVSRLEAEGGAAALDADPTMRVALDEANDRHAAAHGGHRVAGAGDPRRAKCLHAHLAFGLACGGGPIVDWIARRADIAWPGRCCLRPEEGP